jgi:hypothetical protein
MDIISCVVDAEDFGSIYVIIDDVDAVSLFF